MDLSLCDVVLLTHSEWVPADRLAQAIIEEIRLAGESESRARSGADRADAEAGLPARGESARARDRFGLPWWSAWRAHADNLRSRCAAAVAVVLFALARHTLRHAPSTRRDMLRAASSILSEAIEASLQLVAVERTLVDGITPAPAVPSAPTLEAARDAAALAQHVSALSDRVAAGHLPSVASSASHSAGPAAFSAGGVLVPLPGEPHVTSWFSAPLQALADQWAFLNHRSFAAIPIEELLRAGFDDERYKHSADVLRACVDRFNAEALWVTTEVLRPPTPRARAAAYVRLIALALALRRHRYVLPASMRSRASESIE